VADVERRIDQLPMCNIESSSAYECNCCDATWIFLEYEIVAMGRRSMNVDVAVMRRYRSYPRHSRHSQ
jgi:hypothetical protein